MTINAFARKRMLNARPASDGSLSRALRPSGFLGVLALAALLGGCATYTPLPLAKKPDLAPSLAHLDLSLPAANGRASGRRIDPARPLTIDQIAYLAVLNDPALAAERGRLNLANAALLQATLLPNPQFGFSFGALISGPGTTSSYAASLSEDLSAILTYRPRVAAARARVRAVNAALLWREWQVAEKARLLAVDLYGLKAAIALLEQRRRLLSHELAAVQQATAAGSLDLRAQAPLLAADASAEQALAARRLAALRQWHQLDGLLGLEPMVRFRIARPRLAPPPKDLRPLIASLPERRPDLIALRLGYAAADENLRAAILAQFPGLVFGGAGGSDTSNVVSAGPQITIGLPLFDRNQGKIAEARATRQLLHEQYRERLDAAAGAAIGLATEGERIAADLSVAQRAQATANRLFLAALSAYQAGNLSQRSLTDYQTTELARALEVVDRQRNLDQNRLALAVALGLGLPRVRLVAADKDKRR